MESSEDEGFHWNVKKRNKWNKSLKITTTKIAWEDVKYIWIYMIILSSFRLQLHLYTFGEWKCRCKKSEYFLFSFSLLSDRNRCRFDLFLVAFSHSIVHRFSWQSVNIRPASYVAQVKENEKRRERIS